MIACSRLLAVTAVALILSSPSSAAMLLVDTFSDGADAVPGDGVCATALGGCTVRAAIMEANALPAPDTVLLPAGTFSIERPWPLADDEGELGAAGDLDVWDDLTLIGAGPSETEIGPGTSDRWERILDVHEGVVTLEDLALRGAYAGFSPASDPTEGGGIYNKGSLILRRVHIEDCIADSWGGGIHNSAGSSLEIFDSRIGGNHAYDGAGISSFGGSVRIFDSEISGNDGSIGAAVYSGSTLIVRSKITANIGGSTISGGPHLRIEESLISDNRVSSGSVITMGHGEIIGTTISGNRSQDETIQVYSGRPDRPAVLNGVTIAHNTASQAIATHGYATVINSIVALNAQPYPHPTESADCGSISSGGGNLIGAGCSLGGLQPSDLFGTPESPLDARLSPLADNGGATATHALNPGSPAIDAGSTASLGQPGACAPLDQRGAPRPVDGNGDGVSRCDIGAFEGPMTLVLDSGTDESDVAPGDGVCATASGSCTLPAAVTEANARPGHDRVQVPPGTYAVQSVEDGGFGTISVVDDLDIIGTGISRVLITGSSSGLSQDLLQNSARLLIADLSIGNCGALYGEALISNQGGDLTLERVSIEHFVSGQGGPIRSSGSLLVRDSVIANNGVEIASAISAGGTVIVENTKIYDNSSYEDTIRFYGGSLLIDRSTITSNSCSNEVCAVNQLGVGNVTIRSSLVSFNSGGSMIRMTRGRIENSTISGNRNFQYDRAMIEGGPDVSVLNSTVVRNESDSERPALSGAFVANSIVAENTTQGDCADVTSGGHNLFGVGCAASALQPSDLMGTEAVPLVPKLAPLRAYGGATNSHALLIGSPALDAGDPSAAGTAPSSCLDTDQRGTARPGDGNADGIGRCDIGAYELREACSDLQDNDDDGRTDALDAGCRDVLGTIENPKCQDGIDNDGDGKFDFDGGASANGGIALGSADPQCKGVGWRNKEGASCGIGVELVSVLLLLRLLGRRQFRIDSV